MAGTGITGANAIPTTLLATGEEERERLKVCSVRINSTSSYCQSRTTQLNLREFSLSGVHHAVRHRQTDCTKLVCIFTENAMA
ncbi:hypothetical protein ONT16_03180 [Prevotella copri]|uniref:Uncharacterized protein n=1 Tax=Segatella copri TaxID=165179 RepID=A0AAP3BC85_9BACT|nr:MULTISPECIES: hypothetical protein [Prevotellaceae]MCW4127291.1 hypothetical protein [Segatella copri]MCW4414253.1 hypothetical protein [Segatella copri]MCW4420410.1 hypothetical protein [Segatella copri]RHC73273.1 hypothetical protein DW830_13170 [Prevotella sp. AM34-19LB]